MVKFGKHIEVFNETDNESGQYYVVPYNEIKAHIRPPPPAENNNDNNTPSSSSSLSIRDEFVRLWRECLARATDEFSRSTQEFWSRIFAAFEGDDAVVRGALPGTAISLYVQKQQQQQQPSLNNNNNCDNDKKEEDAQELLVLLKKIYEVSYHNTEALRKLVKKYDKHRSSMMVPEPPPPPLSPELLPLLYSANFTVGQPNLELGIDLLRQLLLLRYNDQNNTTASATTDNNYYNQHSYSSHGGENVSLGGYESDQSNHDIMVQVRQVEFDWLERLTQSMEPWELDRLVAHRGFHSVQDHSHSRPIENSLNAYEAAWTNGIRICECDIALTKDEKLVLAHDETFSRLALHKDRPVASKKVQDLTFKELLALPLTSTSRPPLLVDVLRSAEAIGDQAQLVIEIKPGNEAAATALAQLLSQHPEFWPCIAVIMSFDAYTIHQLRQELHRTAVVVVAAAEPEASQQLASNATLGHHRSHSRSISFSAGLDVLGLSPALGPAMMNGAGGLSNFSLSSSSPGMLHSHSKQLLPPSASNNSLSASRMQLSSSSNNLLLGPRTPVLSPEEDNDNDGPWMVGQSPALTSRNRNLPDNGVQRHRSPSPMALGRTAHSTPPPPPPPPPSVAPAPIHKPPTLQMPKLMLLTVAEEPKTPCHLRVSVADLTPVEAWLNSGGDDGPSLDGVYLQFEPAMLQPAGTAALRKLSQTYAVGVWTQSGRDPDNYETFHQLAHEANVTFVNTDLPASFRSSVARKKKNGGGSNKVTTGGSGITSSSLYKRSITSPH